MQPFADRLADAVKGRRSPVVVGLDPRVKQLPDSLRPGDSATPDEIAAAYEKFCIGVIDAVSGHVGVVKPQLAFFEQIGPAGMVALANVISYARNQGLIVIADGKRNDIGSTATAYAGAYLAEADHGLASDSLTVSPYLGEDSITPFVDSAKQSGTGIFVLVKTSNPGGGMLQDLVADGKPIYQHVAEFVQRLAESTTSDSGYGAVGAVVGATYPDQLRELRSVMTNAWILIPGFGAQGGTAADVVAGFDENGLGAVINSSRGIIFAHAREEYASFGNADWQRAVEQAAIDMNEQLRSETPAGRL
ncbi:MAG: orotidine-5'-phosphate decarboxylase [Planctomycetales bacterium]|nr:orotidine-5'-phosphate decarboxylase [Planctomycetales bacterium]